MLERPFLADLQAQVVESGELVVVVHACHSLLEGGGTIEEHGAEVEIVA